jgi:hypothetical protein
VTGELVRILLARLAGRLNRPAAAADKKLRRLELLLYKVHSAVEVSEKHTIENAWLLKWRDTLKEAAAEGDEVLAAFKERQRASTDAVGGPATTTTPATSRTRSRNDRRLLPLPPLRLQLLVGIIMLRRARRGAPAGPRRRASSRPTRAWRG